jgi:IS30 family transposase
MRMGKTHRKLTACERENIAIWLSQGVSKRAIARRLKRSDSTIRDEIKRNSHGEDYVAVHAQAKWERKKSEAGYRHPLKNKSVYKYVMRKLRSGWSPEQISGRLRLMKPDNAYWHISHECIYQFIYAQENKSKQLYEYLPRKQKRRRKKHGRTCHRSRIPDRVSIHQRSPMVEARDEFGHWEGDSIVGRAHKGGIHTQVERKTRFLKASLLSNLKAQPTAHAVSQMFDELEEGAKKSTTVDNGKEMTNHKDFGIPTYFADPYSSWQRGTSENTNGLIRRYLPKKTDLTKVTQKELAAIIDELNNRPRKCLGFHTPKEMFEKELQIIGARIQS